MNEGNSTPQFEEDVRRSFAIPDIRPEFIDHVYGELMHHADEKSRKPHHFLGLRPAWMVALAILTLLTIATLAIGPQRVYAAFMKLFGYIPGVGIVDQSSPIRMLAEPIHVTRDGITVSVNQAVLTASDTRFAFGISGVPSSAYPKTEAVSGCIEHEYLRLPDGTRVEGDAPIPARVNEATFVLPCIFNTLPGTAPTDWELPLRFVIAPPTVTILPIIAVTPQVTPTANQPGLIGETPTAGTSASSQAAVSVDKIIETTDGYILLGSVRPNLPEGNRLQITGPAILRDTDGKKVNYTIPNDVQPLNDSSLGQGGSAWVAQIKGAGVKFPLTIRFFGVILSQVEPQASAMIKLDVGTNPQPEQIWEVNQDVQLAGHTIRLVSVTAQSDGYSFRIDPGQALSGVSVEIEGHTANGGGGGGGGGNARIFNSSLIYDDLPKGELTILFSNPISSGPAQTWQVDWQPGTAREYPAATGSSNVCLTADTFLALKPLPAGLDGRVVFTQLNPQRQIVLTGMDRSQQKVIVSGSGRAAVTLNGTHLAYPGDDGIRILYLASGKSTVIAGIMARDLHWSPDGSQIAYVNSGDLNGVFVNDRDGKNPKQLSNLGYESIAGWSPDGSTLYYAIPGSGGDGFLLRSVELSSGNTKEMFVLENSSRKAPLPATSPDGKWIAYRAGDNSSLYIKGMDGSRTRLVLDNPATAINGIVWEKESHLLGVSLITPEYPDGEIILIAPDSCETYQLPGLSGELDGVLIP